MKINFSAIKNMEILNRKGPTEYQKEIKKILHLKL